jgi:hypothetical protein
MALNQITAWAEALDLYNRAATAEKAYERDFWLPAYEKVEEIVSALPHQSVHYVAHAGTGKQMSTDNARDVQGAQGMLRACPDATTEYMNACRQLVTAHEERQAQERSIREQMAEQEERMEQLSQARSAAWSQLLLMPAPDQSALLWKLNELFGEGERDPDGYAYSWSKGIMDALLSDARRHLAGGLSR